MSRCSQAFGHSINSYGQVQRYIGEGYALTEVRPGFESLLHIPAHTYNNNNNKAAKAFVYNVARDCGADVENRINTDAVKLFASTGDATTLGCAS